MPYTSKVTYVISALDAFDNEMTVTGIEDGTPGGTVTQAFMENLCEWIQGNNGGLFTQVTLTKVTDEHTSDDITPA